MTLDRVFDSLGFSPETQWSQRIGNIDGVPFYENEHDFLINKRADDDYRTIKAWVDAELMPYMTRKSINIRYTSYGLKHIAQKEIGFYVSNGDIKLALMENDVPFRAVLYSPNTMYPLSESFFRASCGKRVGKCRAGGEMQ